MKRLILLLSLLVVASLAMAGNWKSESPVQDTAELKAKRISILEDRVEQVKRFVDSGRAGSLSLSQPKIDLISAKLEYAEAREARRTLLKTLLAEFDTAIEAGTVAVDSPRRADGREIHVAISNLLWLQAERVRYEIQLKEL